VSAPVQRPVNDQSGADSGSDRNQDEVPGVVACSKPHLPEGSEIHIIIDNHGQVKMLAQLCLERKVAPVEAGRPGDNALLVERYAWRPDANAAHLTAAKCRVG